MAQQWWIGTSGWNYDTFVGTIYSNNTPKSRFLENYCRFFNTVELNASFYRFFPEKTWIGWYSRTPQGFIWSVKAHRIFTHIKRLQVEKEELERFFDRVAILKEKLGVVLFQLPPSLCFDPVIFGCFLDLLPSNVRIAWEVRHESWFVKDVFQELEKRNIAWVISHTAGKYPMKKAFTADFIYLRLHGAKGLYRGSYGKDGLRKWLELIKDAGNREAYIYFDNTYDGSAAKDALMLKEMLAS